MTNEFSGRIAVDWHRTLVDILQRAGAVSGGVVAFDLDSTVFDNRPRQARIVREFGRAAGVPALETCQAFHFESGWDLAGALVACGLERAEADARLPELKRFWQERFFTSEYCRDDIEIVGAPRYLRALAGAGARIVYVTGRHEAMREGSVSAMQRCGLLAPGGGVELLMKPTLATTDDAFKRDAHRQLAGLGALVAAFDNEPMHINDYAERFPSAVSVHLATDHSGRQVALRPTVISVPHFAY